MRRCEDAIQGCVLCSRSCVSCAGDDGIGAGVAAVVHSSPEAVPARGSWSAHTAAVECTISSSLTGITYHAPQSPSRVQCPTTASSLLSSLMNFLLHATGNRRLVNHTFDVFTPLHPFLLLSPTMPRKATGKRKAAPAQQPSQSPPARRTRQRRTEPPLSLSLPASSAPVSTASTLASPPASSSAPPQTPPARRQLAPSIQFSQPPRRTPP